MSKNPKRPWFRFHLLTAVLMMLIAAGLLWQNSVPRHVAWYLPKVADHGGTERLQQEMMQDKFWIKGWPLVYSMQYVDTARGPIDDPGHAIVLLMNAGIGMAIMFAGAYVSESLLRRREARKP